MRIVELDRINELAAKAKSVGLTDGEIAERDTLRKSYLAQIRGQVLHSLSGVTLLDENGNDVTPQKLRDTQVAHCPLNNPNQPT